MLMIRKYTDVTRDKLRDIPTPEGSNSWKPLAHFDVVNTLRERTAWSLYNACTERMKSQSAGRQVDGFRALNSVLVELN